jgi:sigma-54-specific transcriptional regulator
MRGSERALDADVPRPDLVFEDPRSRALLTRIERIARADLTVLITGETGTGKEGVARLLHARSARASARFVAVNCAAISEALLEAELFGHERGAFTGALARSEGWFEAAHGGTLFLDEIGDLPFGAQAKLLRVLQEREVVRVGARRPIAIDVRLIAATNADLPRAVAEGRFREDLFYRLHVAPLLLLPLRERPGDILPLAERFLRESSRRLGLPPACFAPDARARLHAHRWPGNVRELENAVHLARMVTPDAIVRAEALELAGGAVGRPHHDARGEQALEAAVLALLEQDRPDLHAHIDSTVLRTVYAFTDRNQVRTAALLGISRNVVRGRLAAYGLLTKTTRAARTGATAEVAPALREPIPITRRALPERLVAGSRAARRG